MILVTGGAGYIGSHFVKTYLDRNPEEQVLVVDNLSEGHKAALRFSKRVHLIKHDIGETRGLEAILAQNPVDAVVHFAASCYVGESQHDPSKYFQNNVANSISLFRALDAAKVKRVVFSSSCATYGNPQYVPMDEQHPQNPINIYGLTKHLVEQVLAGYAESLGWSVMLLRYFNAAGADDSGLIGEHHDPETHLIPLVLQAAAGKRPHVEIYGSDYDTPDGTCVRDYIHVSDLAVAHCQALEYLKTQPGCHKVNLGTTRGTSVQEIIAMCESVTGLKVPVKQSPRRAGDPPTLVANADKAQSLLGWTPQYDLRRIIETAWAWEQNPRY